MRWIFTCGIWAAIALSAALGQQDARLAQQYFRDGEYEKAAVMYERLFELSGGNDFYFDRYIESLLYLEDFDQAEKSIKQQLKSRPEQVNLYVTYGKVLERQHQYEEADKQYERAIEKLGKNQAQVTRLASAFTMLTKYDLAIAAYERGIELFNDPRIFAYNLAELYRRKGDAEQMVTQYLNSLEENPGRINHLQTLFQRYLSDSDFDELQRQLYTRIQEQPNELYYPELLAWVFIQREDFRAAFRQVQALDRRLRENGGRVYQLAEIALNESDYDVAIDAFDYIVEKKGPASTFYIDAKRQALRARRFKLVEGYDYTREELMELREQYRSFLDEFGRSRLTAAIVLELAELEAYYLNELDESIALLQEMIDYPNVDMRLQARAKLNLADIYLIKGEIWEATLLYSQVDKDFKEDLLGHEARFRNARLSYYNGDFQWAQSQFEVLKASTSKLIANDALDLSVFIMDNLGLDTTDRALQLYADADLLIFQNKFEEALAVMDTLMEGFPGHQLEDDVLYLKARIFRKKREWEKAAEVFAKIAEQYPEEIRADNALFALAELYERQLDQPDKAMELYERIFVDYSGSTFAVEARKRFRKLRGDGV